MSSPEDPRTGLGFGFGAVYRRLDRLLGRGTDSVVHECRHCGSTVPDADSDCPTCDGDGIATYDIEE